MGRTGGGCLVGMVLFGVAFPTLGLVLLGAFGLSTGASAIGGNDTWLMVYVIVGMTVCYVLPVVVFGGVGRILRTWRIPLVGIPTYLLVASFVFALPAGFIAEAGCKAGNEKAVWAVRVSPIMYAAETFFAPPEEKLTCEYVLTGGS